MLKNKSAIQVSLSRKIFVVCNTLFFALLVFICFYPLWYVFIQSLSDSTRATKALLLPVGLTLENYVELMKMPEIFRAFIVSILRTVIGTAGTVFCCMYAGYLFTKETLPFRKVWYRMLVITMYVGGGLIPTYLVYKSYGLLNTFGVYVIPSLIGAYYVILIKTFVEQLPSALVESAKIDGASEMRVFISIILPLSLPIAATIAIYCTNGHWNSWFDNQMYTVTEKNLTTLQFLLYNYLNKTEKLIEQLELEGATSDELAHLMTPRGIKMTVTMISVMPIMCVYPFMQRYLIKGILIGAIKG